MLGFGSLFVVYWTNFLFLLDIYNVFSIFTRRQVEQQIICRVQCEFCFHYCDFNNLSCMSLSCITQLCKIHHAIDIVKK